MLVRSVAAACIKLRKRDKILDMLFFLLSVFFYPIPIHSKHSLIALLSTVSASPRKAPKQIIAAAPTINAN